MEENVIRSSLIYKNQFQLALSLKGKTNIFLEENGRLYDLGIKISLKGKAIG